MELENIILRKLASFRKPKASCFLSYVEDRPSTNTNNIIYTYKYIQTMYPKGGLVAETKGGGKEGKKDRKYNGVYNICVGTRQGNTLQT
jgi:hypothetical protein